MADFLSEQIVETTQTPYTEGRNDTSRYENNSTPGQTQPAHGAPKFGTMVPNRIFVGGLPSSTGEEELAMLFSRWGRVRQAKIIADRACISKGYGFVTYETEEEANRALLECADLIYRDRKLNVAPAIKKQPIGYENVMQSPSPTSTPTMYYPAAGIPLYQNGMQLYNAPTPGSPVTPSFPQAPVSTPQQISTPPQQQVQQTVMTPVQTEMNPAVPAFYPQVASLPSTPQGGYPRQVLCSPIFFPPNQQFPYIQAQNAPAPSWPQPNQWRWVTSPGYAQQPPTSPSVSYLLIPIPGQQPQAPPTEPPPANRQQQQGDQPNYIPIDSQAVQYELIQNQGQNGHYIPNGDSRHDEQSQMQQTRDPKKELPRNDSESAQTPALIMAPPLHHGFNQPLTVNTQFGGNPGLLQVQGQPLIQTNSCPPQQQPNQLSNTQQQQRQKLQPLVFSEPAQPVSQALQSNCLMLYGAHGQVYVVDSRQMTPGWDEKGQSLSLPSTPYRQQDSDSGVDGLSAPSEDKSHGSVYTNSPREQIYSQGPREQYQLLPFRPELGLSPGFQNFERRRFGYYRQRRPYRGFYRNNFGRGYYGAGYGGYYDHQRPRFQPIPMHYQQFSQESSQMLTPPYTPGVPPPSLVTEDLVKQVADLEISA